MNQLWWEVQMQLTLAGYLEMEFFFGNSSVIFATWLLLVLATAFAPKATCIFVVIIIIEKKFSFFMT